MNLDATVTISEFVVQGERAIRIRLEVGVFDIVLVEIARFATLKKEGDTSANHEDAILEHVY